MVIFNTETSEHDDTRLASLGSASFVAYLALIGEPFIVAIGQVLLRSMRELNNMTVSCYSNIIAFVVQFIWLAIAGDDFFAYRAFDVIDWLAITCCSVCLVFMQVLAFTALQNMPVPVIQPLLFV